MLSCYILAKEDFYNVYKYRPYTLTYEVVISSQKRTSTTGTQVSGGNENVSCYILAKEDFYNECSDERHVHSACCYILAKEDFYNSFGNFARRWS